jgi:hypothetical protein
MGNIAHLRGLQATAAVLLAFHAGRSTVRCGFLEASASDASRVQHDRHLLQAPEPAPGTINGTFEPTNPAYYAAKQEAIKQALRLNQTFFANLNQSDVAPITKISNGTFEIKPVVAAGQSSIEDASTEGKTVTACIPLRCVTSISTQDTIRLPGFCRLQ